MDVELKELSERDFDQIKMLFKSVRGRERRGIRKDLIMAKKAATCG